jgi:hypothetical protein
MEVRRCFPSMQVRFSVPSSSDLTPTKFEYPIDGWRLTGFALTKNNWRDIEVMKDRVDQAYLFRLWPNNVALKDDRKERSSWFAGNSNT